MFHGRDATSSSLCVGRPRFNTSDGYWNFPCFPCGDLKRFSSLWGEEMDTEIQYFRILNSKVGRKRWRGAADGLDKIVEKFEEIGVWAEREVLHACKIERTKPSAVSHASTQLAQQMTEPLPCFLPARRSWKPAGVCVLQRKQEWILQNERSCFLAFFLRYWGV